MTTLQEAWVKKYFDLLTALEMENLLHASHLDTRSIRIVSIDDDEYVVFMLCKGNHEAVLWIVFDDEFRWLRFDSLGDVYKWLNQYYEVAKIDEYGLQSGKFKHIQTFKMNLRPMHSMGA